MLDINFFLIHPVSTSSSWNVGILHHITVNTSDSQTFGGWGRGGAGDAVKALSAMETYKKQTNRYQLCLFLFSNNVDLKNNNKNYRKPFWIFWVREELQWICFKSFCKQWNNLRYCYEKVPMPPLAPLIKGQRGNAHLYSTTLRCPWSLACAGCTSLLNV